MEIGFSLHKIGSCMCCVFTTRYPSSLFWHFAIRTHTLFHDIITLVIYIELGTLLGNFIQLATVGRTEFSHLPAVPFEQLCNMTEAVGGNLAIEKCEN